MRPMTRIKAAALAALLLLLPGAALAAKAMPNFLLSSAADEKKISSDEFKDKVLLVTFFATWCPPCREEIPEFIGLQKELGERGFSVLGISVDEGGSKIVNKLIEQTKINYPVVMADEAVIAGFGGLSGVPTSFLVNRKGNVVKNYPGYVSHAVLRQDIDELLAEQSRAN
jgi:thiol-disulfide isomerase/thioredoxin